MIVVGCGGKKSKTTNTDSAGFSTPGEKQAFLEQYVTFHRTFEDLEFIVSYIDGGDGRVPGPTDRNASGAWSKPYGRVTASSTRPLP